MTPFMDRDKVQVPQTQVNFIDSFLLPTFKTLQKSIRYSLFPIRKLTFLNFQLLPEFQQIIDVITENRKKWCEVAA